MRVPSLRAGLAVFLPLAMAMVLAGALIRVPEGRLAALDKRLLEPGWHWRLPFAATVELDSQGSVSIPLAHLRSREGAMLAESIDLGYRVLPDRLQPGELYRAGSLQAFAAQALEPITGVMLEHAGDIVGHADVLPPAVDGSLRAALAAQGLQVTAVRLHGAATPRPGPAVPLRAATRASGRKILLIGLDGADWDVAGPLMSAGRMPALAALAARGSAGPLLSYDPMMSPLLWTTAVTGVGPDRHGIADFTLYRGAGDARSPITSSMRRVPALWNLLGNSGLRSGWVGWWASFPAEPIDGYVASSLVSFYAGRPQGAAPASATFPASWMEEMRARLTAPEAVPAAMLDGLASGPLPPDPAQPPPDEDGPEPPAAFLRKVLGHSLTNLALGLDLLQRDLDMVAVYFEGIDMVGHRFQHCLEPALEICPAEEKRLFGSTVPAFYALQDRWIGRLVEAAGDGWTVLVMSDHGFYSAAGRPRGVLPYTTGQPVEWHRRQGMLIASGPGIVAGSPVTASLFDITPTVMALMGAPVAAEREGRVLEEILDPEALASRPWPEVASYGERAAPAAIPEDGEEEADGQEALLSMLRGLGYVEAARAAPGSPAAGSHAAGEERRLRPGATYYRNLATYHLKRGESAAAEDALRSALREKPLPKTYQLLAESLARGGRTDAAVRTLEDGIEAFPDLALENILWGVELLVRSGRVADAAALYRRHLEGSRLRPGLAETCRGLIAEGEGRKDEAAGLYQAALEADPTRTLAARRWLALLAARGEGDRLEPYLHAAVAAAPRSDEAWALLGTTRGLQGDHAGAVAALRQALALAPGDSAHLRNLAAALGQSGEHRQAAAAFLELAALEPDDAEAQLGLGTARRLSGDLDGALEAFEAAERLRPDRAEPLLGRCLVLAQMQRRDEALRLLREGLKAHPEDPGLLRLLQRLTAS